MSGSKSFFLDYTLGFPKNLENTKFGIFPKIPNMEFSKVIISITSVKKIIFSAWRSSMFFQDLDLSTYRFQIYNIQ